MPSQKKAPESKPELSKPKLVCNNNGGKFSNDYHLCQDKTDNHRSWDLTRSSFNFFFDGVVSVSRNGSRETDTVPENFDGFFAILYDDLRSGSPSLNAIWAVIDGACDLAQKWRLMDKDQKGERQDGASQCPCCDANRHSFDNAGDQSDTDDPVVERDDTIAIVFGTLYSNRRKGFCYLAACQMAIKAEELLKKAKELPKTGPSTLKKFKARKGQRDGLSQGKKRKDVSSSDESFKAPGRKKRKNGKGAVLDDGTSGLYGLKGIKLGG